MPDIVHDQNLVHFPTDFGQVFDTEPLLNESVLSVQSVGHDLALIHHVDDPVGVVLLGGSEDYHFEELRKFDKEFLGKGPNLEVVGLVERVVVDQSFVEIQDHRVLLLGRGFDEGNIQLVVNLLHFLDIVAVFDCDDALSHEVVAETLEKKVKRVVHSHQMDSSQNLLDSLLDFFLQKRLGVLHELRDCLVVLIKRLY